VSAGRDDGIQAELAGLRQGQDALQEGLDRLQQGLGQLLHGQERLAEVVASNRADTMARIDRLQDLLVRTREDIAVNFGRADRAEDAALGVRRDVESLGREVSAMERQIQRLQADVQELQAGRAQ
jgi:chaperonin cofactor prefoldin